MRLVFVLCTLLASFAATAQKADFSKTVYKKAKQVLGQDLIKQADKELKAVPITVTATTSERSAGGKHDFFSEGDYWWPDPANPDGPYIRRDGLTNPDNFVAHRHAMIRFSRIVGTLASAWRLTRDGKYVTKAMEHCKAWFVDTATLMNPNLLYAQAIKGRETGRGIGIIDMIQLMEVAQGLLVMQSAPEMDQELLVKIKAWFGDYLNWVTTHPYGIDEMNAANNHGTCYVLQVACFARFTENQKWIDWCRERYKTVLLPSQMAVNGSFPMELERTKPYGYSLFDLDAMVGICQILSDKNHDLWQFRTSDGRSIQKGISFLYPYIANKATWSYKQDVMYWDSWPVAQPALIFGAAAFGDEKWLNTWVELNHFPEEGEVIRNLPIRNPLIWF